MGALRRPFAASGEHRRLLFSAPFRNPLGKVGSMSSWRVVARGLALVVCACLAAPNHGYGQPRAHIAARSAGGAHLYVLLGLGNNSPGLSEFAGRMQHHGIPTTVANHSDWPAL